jgi:hypothetical protein
MAFRSGSSCRTVPEHSSAIVNEIFQPISRDIQYHSIYRFFIAARGQGALLPENAVNPIFDV